MNLVTVVSEDKQIEAILKKEEFVLVCNTLGKNELIPEDYDKVITVSFDKIHTYLEINCLIWDLVNEKPDRTDGYYALRTKKNWTVFLQERGVRFNEMVLDSEEKILNHFIEFNLGYPFK